MLLGCTHSGEGWKPADSFANTLHCSSSLTECDLGRWQRRQLSPTLFTHLLGNKGSVVEGCDSQIGLNLERNVFQPCTQHKPNYCVHLSFITLWIIPLCVCVCFKHVFLQLTHVKNRKSRRLGVKSFCCPVLFLLRTCWWGCCTGNLSQADTLASLHGFSKHNSLKSSSASSTHHSLKLSLFCSITGWLY